MLFAIAPYARPPRRMDSTTMELYLNNERSCSDVHERRLTTLVHTTAYQSQWVWVVVRLSQTDSEFESSGRTPGQTWVTVSDLVVLNLMLQACNY